MSHHQDIPLTTYEVHWASGHVERIAAHQVSWPNSMSGFLPGVPEQKRRVQFHAELDGRWTLQLSAWEDDIRTIRNLATEDVAPDGAS